MCSASRRNMWINGNMFASPMSPLLVALFAISSCSGANPIKEKVTSAMDSVKTKVIDAEFAKADSDHSNSISREVAIFNMSVYDGRDEFEVFVLGNEMVAVPRDKKNAAEFASGLELPLKNTHTEPGQHSFDSNPAVSEEFKKTFDKIENFGVEFWSAFFKSVAMIIATELGDKTFFIAAIMAMKHSRTLVYSGAVAALAFMTVLSVAIGFALPKLIPKDYTHYLAVALFAYFGYKLLNEAYEMYKAPPEKNEELEEVEEELGKGMNGKKGGHKNFLEKRLERFIPVVFGQAFALTFLAEWGDRSQIATIALASSKDPFGVTVGGTLGHAFCTGLAVIGGRLLATRISEQQVAFFGGILFWAFAIHELYVGP